MFFKFVNESSTETSESIHTHIFFEDSDFLTNPPYRGFDYEISFSRDNLQTDLIRLYNEYLKHRMLKKLKANPEGYDIISGQVLFEYPLYNRKAETS